MASGTFQKTSLGWEVQLFQRRIGEWLERFFSNSNETTRPDWQIPDWLQKTIFWLVVIGVILWAGWQLYNLVRPYVSRYWQSVKSTIVPSSVSVVPTLTAAEWLARSRTAQQQGNYREACRALYMATLQRLSDDDLIRQEPSRTDGEYLQLVHDLAPSHSYELLIQTHERLWFSQDPVSKEEVDRCWQAYREIEKRGNGHRHGDAKRGTSP